IWNEGDGSELGRGARRCAEALYHVIYRRAFRYPSFGQPHGDGIQAIVEVAGFKLLAVDVQQQALLNVPKFSGDFPYALSQVARAIDRLQARCRVVESKARASKVLSGIRMVLGSRFHSHPAHGI
ncbi:MAG: hypothetical protein ACRDZ5_06730, partial [Acidimicrobiales bacterium]